MRTDKIIKGLTFSTVFFAVLSAIELAFGLYLKRNNIFFTEVLPTIFLTTIILSFLSNILITFIKFKE